MSSEAIRIYQQFLDVTSKAIHAGRASEVAGMMVYPQTMQTLDGAVGIEDAASMRESVATFHAYLHRMGATDYLRICEWAEFDRDDTEITGGHTSYIVKGGTYVVKPYGNRMWLRCEDGLWKGNGIIADALYRDCMLFSETQLRAARDAVRNDDLARQDAWRRASSKGRGRVGTERASQACPRNGRWPDGSDQNGVSG